MEQLQLSHLRRNQSLDQLIMPIEQVINDLKYAVSYQLPMKIIADFKDREGYVYQVKIRSRILQLDPVGKRVTIEDLDTRGQYTLQIEQILTTKQLIDRSAIPSIVY